MATQAKDTQSAAPTPKLRDFENLRTLLRNSKSVDGTSDLYNHLIEVINHIVMHCPDDAIDKFEEISYLIKNSKEINIEEFLNLSQDRSYAKPGPEVKAIVDKFVAKARKFFEVRRFSI